MTVSRYAAAAALSWGVSEAGDLASLPLGAASSPSRRRCLTSTNSEYSSCDAAKRSSSREHASTADEGQSFSCSTWSASRDMSNGVVDTQSSTWLHASALRLVLKRSVNVSRWYPASPTPTSRSASTTAPASAPTSLAVCPLRRSS